MPGAILRTVKERPTDITGQTGFLQLDAPVGCPKCSATIGINAILHKDGSPCDCPHVFRCELCNIIFYINEVVKVEKIPLIVGGA